MTPLMCSGIVTLRKPGKILTCVSLRTSASAYRFRSAAPSAQIRRADIYFELHKAIRGRMYVTQPFCSIFENPEKSKIRMGSIPISTNYRRSTVRTLITTLTKPRKGFKIVFVAAVTANKEFIISYQIVCQFVTTDKKFEPILNCRMCTL